MSNADKMMNPSSKFSRQNIIDIRIFEFKYGLRNTSICIIFSFFDESKVL